MASSLTTAKLVSPLRTRIKRRRLDHGSAFRWCYLDIYAQLQQTRLVTIYLFCMELRKRFNKIQNHVFIDTRPPSSNLGIIVVTCRLSTKWRHVSSAIRGYSCVERDTYALVKTWVRSEPQCTLITLYHRSPFLVSSMALDLGINTTLLWSCWEDLDMKFEAHSS